jgi:hypothetical protein
LAKTRTSSFTEQKISQKDKEIAISHASNVLGRSFSEVLDIYDSFATTEKPDRFLHVIYWLGKLAIEEVVDNNKRTITFSPILKRKIRASYSWRNLGKQHQKSFKRQ